MANKRKTLDANGDDVMQMELILLVGMQKDTVTLENWQFLQIKHASYDLASLLDIYNEEKWKNTSIK